MNVIIVGCGYVGLPLAHAIWNAGHHVIGYDADERRVKAMQAGESYVEDIPDAVLTAMVASERFVPVSDLDGEDGYDVAIITVPTPLVGRAPDLTFVRRAAETLAPMVRPGSITVLESTTYPSTTTNVLQPMLEDLSGLGLNEFHVGFSPERIDPGNAHYNVVNTPKLVAGCTPRATAAICEFYRSFVDSVVPVSSPSVAELAKLLENTYRHVNIALVNEVAVFAHALDIDVREAIAAAATKPFGYQAFSPGPGVGGHCLPIDPHYLGWHVRDSLGATFRFAELASDINDAMPAYVVQRITSLLNERNLSVNGARIVQVGLAYKADTADARESPAVNIAQRLLDLGADLRIVDTMVPNDCFARKRQLPAAWDEADIAILVVNHSNFNPEMMLACDLVFDCRGVLRGPNVHQL